MKLFISLLLLLLSGFVSAADKAPPEGFNQFIEQMKLMAREKGISDETIEVAFKDVSFIHRAVKQDRNQPEFKITMEDYLRTRLPEWKVAKARKLFKQHRELLTEIGDKYQVHPAVIVALWGVETNFGAYTGKHYIVSALATMSFEGRRANFFRKELMAALQILDEGHISVEDMKGSWAGAMGQNQFMPSSFLAFAVDHSGDGRKDIWNSLPDVFASIANYLKQSGWDNSETWGRQVRVPADFDESLAGLKKKKSLNQWQALGVRLYDGRDLPKGELETGMVMPDGITGRIYLAFNNYYVLLRWNRSNYFVASVNNLSDRVKFPPVQ